MGMPFLSREILEALDIGSPFLYRWRRAGFIEPEVVLGRRSEGAIWPDWAMRMSALLRLELTPGGHPAAQLDMLRKVAAILAVFPDVPFVVIADDDLGMPAWTAEEVYALTRRPVAGAAIIAIPALEDIAP